MKTCARCGFQSITPEKDFPKDKNRKDGLNSWCRRCYAERSREWYANNKDRASKRAHEYYVDNTEEIKQSASQWQKDHREEVNAGARRRYAENPEPVLLSQARSRAARPEKERIRHAKYSRENPEKRLANEQRRRAHKNGAPFNDFTHAQWVEMQEAYDHRCAYCGKRAKGHLTQDHITPLSKGGSHTASNIVPACRSCNCKKSKGPILAPVQPLLLTIAPSKPKKGHRND